MTKSRAIYLVVCILIFSLANTDLVGQENVEVELIDPEFHPLIGKAIPEINGTTLDGKSFSEIHYKGKVVLLNIWSLSCAVCYKEIKELNLIADHFRSRGVVVVSLMPEDVESLKKKIIPANDYYQLVKPVFNNKEINYSIVANAGDLIERLGSGINGFPCNYIIDTNGVLREFFFGYKASYGNPHPEESENHKMLVEKLERVLVEPPRIVD